jgi:hypothetical protein
MKELMRESRKYAIERNETEFRNRMEYAKNKADEGDFYTARAHLTWAIEALNVLAYYSENGMPV